MPIIPNIIPAVAVIIALNIVVIFGKYKKAPPNW